jgi:hypothetical protein
MPTYVRANGSDTWHWCSNCTGYPEASNIAERVTLPAGQRPSSGELDNQCLGKERNGSCSA